MYLLKQLNDQLLTKSYSHSLKPELKQIHTFPVSITPHPTPRTFYGLLNVTDKSITVEISP